MNCCYCCVTEPSKKENCYAKKKNCYCCYYCVKVRECCCYVQGYCYCCVMKNCSAPNNYWTSGSE
jgi:hypothetical protein